MKNRLIPPLLVFLLGILPFSNGIASQLQLNDVIHAAGDILSYQLSPNNDRVVYRGDQDTDGVQELYSVRLDGTDRVKLNSLLTASEDVQSDYKISQNGLHVVFRVNSPADKLYSVPIGGGTALQLDVSELVDGPLHGTGAFEISADSATVVFIADLVTRSSSELFAVPIAGGTPTQLDPGFSGPVPQGSPEFRVSSDSSYVVFRAKLGFNSEFQLFSVPIGGGTSTQLNDSLAVNGEIEGFDGYFISSDSARVIYLAEQDSIGVQELYSVPIMGGGSTKLNAALTSGNDVVNYVISPNGQTVVYQARLGGSTISHHYAVPIVGGASTQLSKNVVAGGGYVIGGPKGPRAPFFISPDNTRLVYRGKVDDADKSELYSVPLSGGASTKISRSLVSGGNVGDFTDPDNAFYKGYQLSPDGGGVFYFADAEVDEELNLYSVPITGGASTRLSGTPLLSAIPPKLIVSPDSQNVIYFSDTDLDDRIEAIGVSADGVPLVNNLINEDVASFVFNIRQIEADFSIDNTQLIFLDKQADAPDALQLYASSGVNDEDDDGVFNFNDNCIDQVNTDQLNFDGDLLGDECDPDDDNDNVDDGNDAFPFDASESSDNDEDQIGDNADLDDDNDTHLDNADNCPLIANTDQLNTDGDSLGDACDADDDNDGVDDGDDDDSINPLVCRDLDVDACDDCSSGVDGFGPLDDFNQLNDGLDTDSDGQCNVSDPDDDGDTIPDVEDNCSLIPNVDQDDNNGYRDAGGEGDVCEDTSICIPVKVAEAKIALICL